MPLARHEPGVSGDLAGALVLCDICDFGEQRSGCRLADAGDGVEQLALLFQHRVVVDVRMDEGFYLLDLMVQVGQVVFDRSLN